MYCTRFEPSLRFLVQTVHVITRTKPEDENTDIMVDNFNDLQQDFDVLIFALNQVSMCGSIQFVHDAVILLALKWTADVSDRQFNTYT